MADDANRSAADIVTSLDVGNQNLSAQFAALIAALQTIFPQVESITGGTFTCANAASTTVLQPLTKANSIIIPFPTNAAAGTLMAGATSLYLSARTANTSFAYTTANSASAAGTETFGYLLVNL